MCRWLLVHSKGILRVRSPSPVDFISALNGGQVFDAQSQHPASKKTDFPAKHEFIAWEYTHHDDGSNMPGARSTDGVELLSSGAVRIRQVW